MSQVPFLPDLQASGRSRTRHVLHYGILFAVTFYLAISTALQVALVQVPFDVSEDRSDDDAEQVDATEAIVNDNRQRLSATTFAVASVVRKHTTRASALARLLNTRPHGLGTAMSAATVTLRC